MTLLLFVILVAIICCIARYNEDNKLFWTLLISLLAGIAGGALYQKLSSANDTTKSKYECVSPMPTASKVLAMDVFDQPTQDTGVQTPLLAGQGFDTSDIVLIGALSEGVVSDHSQPPQYLDDS